MMNYNGKGPTMTLPPGMKKGNSSNNLNTSFGVCPQCGLIHPPLRPGETCPNAPVTSADNKIVDLNKFFAMLKNVFVSQMEKKKIKDPEKMFKHLIIEVTKILENYKES